VKRLVVLLLLAACHDNHDAAVDGGPDAAPDAALDAALDAPPDAAPPAATLTSFVIGIVQTETSLMTTPHPFADFATLPDPDQGNLLAYASLFP
jgi:hypothetical protein